MDADEERNRGDCWIGLSLARASGLMLAACVGKHTDAFIEQLGVNTDDWGGYERVLPPEREHYMGKDKTQKLERTNGTLRQQTGRWHRRKNKFDKVWEQTQVITRLVVSYFNWIWRHSRFKSTAAQRAGLTARSWNWQDIATCPTLI